MPDTRFNRFAQLIATCRGVGGLPGSTGDGFAPLSRRAGVAPARRLGRYSTRPAPSDERVRLNAAGQVDLELKTSWRDGTTHVVMSPLERMQRLAALVPRPRLPRSVQAP